MASKLPYVNQPGSMVKILDKIRSAKTPDRFTHDFLETKLGFKGGNYRQFIPLAKKLALLGSDGTPTELYKKFRNSDSSKAAMGQALRQGYRELFERNEYAYSLDRDKYKGLVVEITGLESDSRVVQLICQTWEQLKRLAEFDANQPDSDQAGQEKGDDMGSEGEGETGTHDIALGLSYTINLVLPKTDDPAVFNAIFRSLRDNLLRK
jgi:Family of unknown function (DUF5343)